MVRAVQRQVDRLVLSYRELEPFVFHSRSKFPQARRLSIHPALAGIFLMWSLVSQAHTQTLLPSQWTYSPVGRANTVTFSPDTTKIVVAGQSGIQIIDRLFLGLTSSVPTTITAPLAVEFSPDGKTLLLGGSSPSAPQVIVELWNLSTEKLVGRIITGAAANLASALSFSSKGDRFAVATGGQNPAIELWDIPTQTLTANLQTSATQINALAFSSDGSIIADAAVKADVETSSQMGIVELWNGSTGASIKSFSTASGPSGATAVAFSPDETAIADAITLSTTELVSTEVIQVWNITSGAKIHALSSQSNQPIGSVAYSPDGTLIVDSGQLYSQATSVSQGLLELWNASAGTKGATLQVPASITTISKIGISSDSTTIAAVGTQNLGSQVLTSSELETWDISSQSVTSTFNIEAYQQPGSTVNSATPLSLSPDAAKLATAGYFYNPSLAEYSAAVSIFSSSTGIQLASLASSALSGINALAFSPDGSTFADVGIVSQPEGGLAGVLEIWDIGTGTLTAKPNTSANILNAVAFSPDGKLLADTGLSFLSGTSEPIVEVWNVSSNSKSLTLSSTATGGPACLVFSPDGTTVADAGIELATHSHAAVGVVELWNSKTGSQIASLPTAANASLSSIAFSPDGKVLAVGGSTSSAGATTLPTVEIWDWATQQLLTNLQIAPGPTAVSSLAYSPDGTVLFVGTDTGIQTFSASSYSFLSTFTIFPNLTNPALPGSVGKLIVASDGSLFASSAPAGALESWFGVFPNPYFATNPPVTSLTIDPASILGGSPATGVVTISAAAPKGGAVVQLASNSASVLLPTGVSVPAGSASVAFQVTTTAVNTQTPATITAGTDLNAKSFTLTLNPASLAGVNVTPNPIVGGYTSSGTVLLNGPAGPDGTTVTLTSSNPAVEVPASITVPAGKTFTTFAASTMPVLSKTTASITATLNGTTASTTLSVTPAVLSGLSVSPQSIAGGEFASGIVNITGPAPTGGVTVYLSSSQKFVTVPSSVVIPSGQNFAFFTVGTAPTSVPKSAKVSAICGSVSMTYSVQVDPAALTSVTVKSLAITGGATELGTINLDGVAASGGVTVKLSSNSSFAVPPHTVTVPAGKSSATFSIQTKPANTPKTVTILAVSGNTTAAASFTVYPPTLVSVTVSPSSLVGGDMATGVVKLGGVAPSPGITITIAGDQDLVDLPKSVSVAPGKESAILVVKTNPVSAITLGQITATLGSTTQIAPITLNPPTLKSLTLRPSTVKGGSPSVGTVVITSPAPSSGLTISLLSSSDFAAVPSSVVIPSGKTTATFTITTQKVTAKQQVTIKATSLGTSKSASLEVS
jgi:dipeptidyl aminopeptidase/acylaminoacyl peptidase